MLFLVRVAVLPVVVEFPQHAVVLEEESDLELVYKRRNVADEKLGRFHDFGALLLGVCLVNADLGLVNDVLLALEGFEGRGLRFAGDDCATLGFAGGPVDDKVNSTYLTEP